MQSLFVSATHANGENVVFMDCVDPEYTITPPPKGGCTNQTHPHHLMASSAMYVVPSC